MGIIFSCLSKPKNFQVGLSNDEILSSYSKKNFKSTYSIKSRDVEWSKIIENIKMVSTILPKEVLSIIFQYSCLNIFERIKLIVFNKDFMKGSCRILANIQAGSTIEEYPIVIQSVRSIVSQEQFFKNSVNYLDDLFDSTVTKLKNNDIKNEDVKIRYSFRAIEVMALLLLYLDENKAQQLEKIKRIKIFEDGHGYRYEYVDLNAPLEETLKNIAEIVQGWNCNKEMIE